jgi:hypothetical protein
MLFTALDSENKGGLYRWSSGTLSMVANTGTLVPGSSTNFAHFLGFSTSFTNFGTVLVFLADDNNQTGVYELSQGHLRVMADTSMNAPGTTSHFTGFSRPSTPGTWFSGTYETPTGTRSIVYCAGCSPFPLIDGNTPVPGGTGNFSYAANPEASTEAIFFGIDANQKQGIYRYFYNGPNSHPVLLADTNSTIPGTSKKFATFDSNSLSISNLGVAFSAEDDTGRAYIIKRLLGGTNTNLQTVASDIGHPPLAMGGQYIAYLRQGAIYTDWFGTNQRLIGPGNQLLGKTISSVLIGPDAFAGPDIAFAATFTDGSQGLFVANLPEPCAILMLLPGAYLLCRRGRLT